METSCWPHMRCHYCNSEAIWYQTSTPWWIWIWYWRPSNYISWPHLIQDAPEVVPQPWRIIHIQNLPDIYSDTLHVMCTSANSHNNCAAFKQQSHNIQEQESYQLNSLCSSYAAYTYTCRQDMHALRTQVLCSDTCMNDIWNIPSDAPQKIHLQTMNKDVQNRRVILLKMHIIKLRVY